MKKMENKSIIRIIPMRSHQELHVTLKNVEADGKFLQKILLNLEKDKIVINKVVFFGNLAKIKNLLPLVRGKMPFLILADSLPEKTVGKNVDVHISGVQIFREFERLYMAKKWQFPYTSVFTNICRGDFLFEIEGVAADSSENYFLSSCYV